MRVIIVNNAEYRVHPIFDLHDAKSGKIIPIVKRIILCGTINNYGYGQCMVRKYVQKGQKCYRAHKFIYTPNS